DGDAFGFEISTTPLGQCLERQLVTDSFDKNDGSRTCGQSRRCHSRQARVEVDRSAGRIRASGVRTTFIGRYPSSVRSSSAVIIYAVATCSVTPSLSRIVYRAIATRSSMIR